jgi:hypothetical protein
MSIVDAVGVLGGGAGAASGEHAAPRRSRRHAWVAFAYVTILVVLAYRDGVLRRLFSGESFFVGMMACFWLVALMGVAVRMGRLRIDPEGVRWGWRAAGFRMKTPRIARVRVFDDGAALVPRRGPGVWHLLARDWERWDEAVGEFNRLGVPIERLRRRAPLSHRMQGYGRALDAIIVLNSVAATLLFFSG